MKLQQLYREEQGAALLEFTLIVPLLISLTFGLVQAGYMMWAQAGLQHAVAMAARCAAVSDLAQKADVSFHPATTNTPCYQLDGNATTNASSIKSYAADNSWGLNPDTSVFSVNPGSPRCGVMVTAEYPFQLLFTVTLRAQSCYPTTS
jgi:Flp pilus assembly protein TadG